MKGDAILKGQTNIMIRDIFITGKAANVTVALAVFGVMVICAGTTHFCLSVYDDVKNNMRPLS